MKSIRVIRPVIKKVNTKKPSYVNDLTIKDNHNYTVGNNNIVVHNCLTSQQTGIGYPVASLIRECRQVKNALRLDAKIIADGGIKKYADIIKALALGADIVMLGSMLNRALESCAPTFAENKKHEGYTEPGEQINQYEPLIKELFNNGADFYKKFRGMSTKEVQKSWGRSVVRTSEGIIRMNKVEYTLDGWTENLDHYLRSAMSYCNARNLNEFVGKANFNFITENSFRRFTK